MKLPRLKQRYHQVEAGEWQYPVAKGYRLACCDCGLVHILEFKPISKSRIKMRGWRDNRATAAMRAWDRKRKQEKSNVDASS